MIYVGFVGPESLTWENWGKRRNLTLEQVKHRVQVQVLYLLQLRAKKELYNIDHAHYEERFDYSDVYFVSGGCPKGGVDIWAEEIARQVLPEDHIIIYPAEVNQWADEKIEDVGFYPDRTEVDVVKVFKGYKSRNIQIAERCDYLYCIVPFTLNGYCTHHRPFDLTHPKNGGCWTLYYYQYKLNKNNGNTVIIK